LYLAFGVTVHFLAFTSGQMNSSKIFSISNTKNSKRNHAHLFYLKNQLQEVWLGWQDGL